jgi:hypothetical protein
MIVVYFAEKFVPNIDEKNETTVCPTGNLSAFVQRIGNQTGRAARADMG